MLAGPVPATVLRATQFHEFTGQVLARSRGPLAVVPRMRIQPIAAREVANALVELAVNMLAGRVADLAGPPWHELVDLARRLVQARRSRQLSLAVRVPGTAGRAMAGGALLPIQLGPRGRQSFDPWLEAGSTGSTGGGEPGGPC